MLDTKVCIYCSEIIDIQGYTYACTKCYENEEIMKTPKKDPKINQRIEIWARWLTAIIVALTVMLVWHWSGR